MSKINWGEVFQGKTIDEKAKGELTWTLMCYAQQAKHSSWRKPMMSSNQPSTNEQKLGCVIAGLLLLTISTLLLVLTRGCTNSNLPERVDVLEEKVDELRLQTEYLTDLDIEGDMLRANATMDEARAMRQSYLESKGIEPSEFEYDPAKGSPTKDTIMRRAEQNRIRRANSESGGWTPEDDKPKRGLGRYDDPVEEDPLADDNGWDEEDDEDDPD